MFTENKNVINNIFFSRPKIKDISMAEDLIKFLPRKYIDFTNPQGAKQENVNNEICMSLHLNNYKEGKTASRVTYFTGHCIDNITKNKVNVMWFGQAYMRPILYHMQGHNIHVCGTLNYSNEYKVYSLNNPKITTECKDEAETILPIYSGLKEQDFDAFRDALKNSFNNYIFDEWIPPKIINECNLMSLKDAYYEAHFPSSVKKLKKALTCIDFEKLLSFSLSLAKNDMENVSNTHYIPKDITIARKIAASLSFDLTCDQKNTINSIIEIMKSGKCETALVQGDVGSGKTIIAIILMAIMAKSGYQCAMIAPTSVLAEQHYNNINKICSKFDIKTVLLNSSIKTKERKNILNDISSGDAQIIVGTHSLLNDEICYKDLSLVVTDEEHKFGVSQRKKLREKSKENIHSISMSATPIPRTLATTMYGNSVHVYTIKQKPSGRLPIKTFIENDYNNAFDFLLKEIKKGHQCYFVCPKIENGNTNNNVYSVKQIEKMLNDYFSSKYKNISVSTLTGRISNEKKAQVLNDFSNGKIDVLVSTTVIEVGVDVPNTTVIAISNAEYFGLASLHQLRGRVGRNQLQSYCVLISDKSNNKRLSALCSTNDGFEISKLDLQQRGTGDLAGFSQSGFTEDVAIMLNNPKMFEYTQRYAKEIVENARFFLKERNNS